MATAVFQTETIAHGEFFASRETLIESHYPLVKYLAARVASKLPASIEVDDLVSSGVLGLMDAAEKFDAERGIRFRTYAERRIRGAILDHLRSLDWAPRSLRRRVRAYETAQGELEQRFGRTVSSVEVAEYMSVELSEVQDLAYEATSLQVTSLQSCLENDEDGMPREVVDRLADAIEHDPFHQCARAELCERLASAVSSLTEKEQVVISLYYVDELTMKEIGSVLGVNESRVSQLHTKAIGKLRSGLANAF